jgi:4-hydroxymandelate oxidase
MNECLTKFINIKDFELAAKSNLSQMVYDYYAGGACDEITLGANEKAYSQICIKYHVLNDVSSRTSKTTVIGQEINSPIIIGPTAFHALACADGELATARAAKNVGAVFTLSTLSNCSMEEINKIGGHLWYQLYVYRNREITKKLVERAEKLGYRALVITVDSQITGRRERDIRNSFTLPTGIRAGNLETIDIADGLLANHINNLYDQSLNWKDIEWFRSITKLPILIKGIIRADDARKAESCGVNGIVVSNHGGRSLDTSPSTLSVLPEIVMAVSAKTDVLLDGGIRRGTDVLKALALGAKAVMIGRPILWGLAVGGEEGVIKVLQTLNSEFDLAMALSGCKSVSEISPDLIGKMA